MSESHMFRRTLDSGKLTPEAERLCDTVLGMGWKSPGDVDVCDVANYAAAEIERLREEIAKYKTWAASCDPSPAVQAVISELAALQTECSTARWVRDHCLGLLRGQLPTDSIAGSNGG